MTSTDSVEHAHFEITARTLLHLGRDLISSDTVALYELIKNSIDARSPSIRVQVVVRLERIDYVDLMRRLRVLQGVSVEAAADADSLDHLKRDFVRRISPSVSDSKDFKTRVAKAKSLDRVENLLALANHIVVEDRGHGMTRKGLREIYLVIGTPHRLIQKQREDGSQPLLGEKGIGRLSTMRLGDYLSLRSTQAGEQKWHRLEVDWSQLELSNEDQLLRRIEDISVTVSDDELKGDPNEQGTTLLVGHLRSHWSQAKLERLAREQFSRFSDPFSKRRLRLRLFFNHIPITIPRFERELFRHAHAVLHASFDPRKDDGSFLVGKVDYVLRGQSQEFRMDAAHLAESCGESVDTLRSLGPFELEVYWFNRLILRAEADSDFTTPQLKEVLKRWSGGINVYRDGYRVVPYGSTDDDWLDIDSGAFRASGYKVNRSQLIGRLRISARQNPCLVDQTNREGLADRPEKSALIGILQHILVSHLRAYLDGVDTALKKRSIKDVRAVSKQVLVESKRCREVSEPLLASFADTPAVSEAIKVVRLATLQIDKLIKEVANQVNLLEERANHLIYLAGQGQQTEMILHELRRPVTNALELLRGVEHAELSEATSQRLHGLRLELKTVDRRIKTLDPGATSGRRRRSKFDLVKRVQLTLLAHQPRMEARQVKCSLQVIPDDDQEYQVEAVEGMIIQILENLIDNSLHWLMVARQYQDGHVPMIQITIDKRHDVLRFEDNGPGIPRELREQVFQPYFSTKRADKLKGLGLYISRLHAEYHKTSLYLDDSVAGSALRCFILELLPLKCG